MYSPALTDFVVMVKGTSHMFITGPDVVKTVTGEDVTQEELGGALTHAAKSGVAAFVYDDEATALAQVRYLLVVPPRQQPRGPALLRDRRIRADRSCDGIIDLIPDAPNKPYDMKKVIAEVVDDGEFFEVNALWAMNIVCGFARIDGHAIGIVGNQPSNLAGTLDIDASEKAARFVRTCDAFNVPLVTFVDVPGFLPGTDQEYGGIIRHGAKLLYAYCESTVPRVQIITRKAYGGAYVVMNSKSIGADLAFAWPSAEVAVMGAPGAVNLIHRKELEAADDVETKRTELIAEYEERFANPYVAAERGYVDDVIDPRETRRVLRPVAGDAAHQARADAVAQARERAALVMPPACARCRRTRPPRRSRRSSPPSPRSSRRSSVTTAATTRCTSGCAPPACGPTARACSGARGDCPVASAAAAAPDRWRWPTPSS